MSETVITTPTNRNVLDRYTRGATFLSLEHAARMLLSVILPLLVLAGLATAFDLWLGNSDQENLLVTMIISPSLPVVTSTAVMIATALVLSSGLFWLFNRRVGAELPRRPHYQQRLVYRVPLYIAFAISSLLVFLGVTDLLSIVLNTITLIGVTNTNIGQLYLARFLPEAIGLVVISFAAWYQFKLLKGANKGSFFANVSITVSVVLAVILLISAATALHRTTSGGDGNSGSPIPLGPYPASPQSRPSNLYNNY